MKYTYLIVVMLLFFNCKRNSPDEKNGNANKTEDVKQLGSDTLQNDAVVPAYQNIELTDVDKSITIELKQKTLIEKKDEREELQELIINKSYINATKDFTVNFTYPLLNESYKDSHRNFNEFITDHYVNITATEADILERKSLCDSIEAENFREERLIDYKIYNVNDRLVSVLFYKENFYSGAMHPSYTFDCFNFDLNEGVFINYEDFFVQGSENEVLEILNEKITAKIQSGDMYYDCWEVSSADFLVSKNNFVLNETNIEFYFDDCVMCPSYTGSYSIEIPLVDFMSVLKKYELNPLLL